MKSSRFLVWLILCIAAGHPVHALTARQYPDQVIKLVVPFPPGGTSDSVARILAKGLGERLGQSVIIENKGGAGTIIGTQYVAGRPPDGYTLLWITTPFAINDSLFRKLPYDTFRDFTPVVDIVQVPLVLIVNSSSPAKSLSDIVKAAKNDPGKLTFGSSGIGGSPHLATEMFESAENIKLTHVPYQGSAPSLIGLLSDQTDMIFDTLFLTYPQIKQGKARAIAQTGAIRSALLPDVPTMAEAGVAGYEATSWLSVAVRSGTPAEIVQRLNLVSNEVLESKDFKEAVLQQGLQIIGGSSANSEAHLRTEIDKWKRVIREAEIPQQ